MLSIRVSHPFDGFFELKLSDASADAYNSVMALDEIEQLKCVCRRVMETSSIWPGQYMTGLCSGCWARPLSECRA